MLGICTIARKKENWGEATEETIQGIRFAL